MTDREVNTTQTISYYGVTRLRISQYMNICLYIPLELWTSVAWDSDSFYWWPMAFFVSLLLLHDCCKWTQECMGGTGLKFESWKVENPPQNASQHYLQCFLKEIWILKSSCSLKSSPQENGSCISPGCVSPRSDVSSMGKWTKCCDWLASSNYKSWLAAAWLQEYTPSPQTYVRIGMISSL